MPTLSEINFLKEQFAGIVNSRIYQLPSEYIESVRSLPSHLSPHPGPYDFDYTPYLTEILNNLSPMNDIRKVVFMKPSQIGATVGVLENAIGYNIGCAPSSNLFISADKELVKLGMEVKVDQMIDSCGLRDKIFSQSKSPGSRKTGDTTFNKEFPGGMLHAIGARNPGKLRQMSYKNILMDELDGFPDTVGNEGDPVSLAENRTNAFASKRKILYLSTPTVLQTSKIYKLYLQGDQRKYFIPCPRCGVEIVMQWHGKNSDGQDFGIVFKTKKNTQILIPSSVKYICQACGKPILEHEKSDYLIKGRWKPTAETQEQGLVSYWMDATYSPLGMYSWVNMVYDWLKCFDIEKNKIKDMDKYRSFRNTKQGLPFEERGESVTYERVISHRRPYARNKIMNKLAMVETGSNILYLTCAVDVQKASNELLVDIKGWCVGGVSYTIDFRSLPASENVQMITDNCWRDLEKIIEEEIFTSDNGSQYRIAITVVDSGWATDTVYEFCKQYGGGVIAIKGQEYITGNLTYKQMSKETRIQTGLDNAYMVNATMLKRRITRALKSDWNTGQLQPNFYMNFPEDLRDDYFQMFTAEYLAEKRDKVTGKFKGFQWKAIQGRANHAFDTAGYSLAAIEIIAESHCKSILGLKALNWNEFWNWAKVQ
jgi:phage terminase large subunit GpA-like protein